MSLSRWARLSIAAKLPLSLAVLLSVGFGSMTAAVYYMMRGSVLDVASERLDRAADQMAAALGGTVRQRLGLLQSLATRVHAVAVVPQPESESSIAGMLQSYAGNNSMMGIEWWDADARRVAAAGATLPELAMTDADALAATIAEAPGPVVLPYRRDPDMVSYAIGVAVRGVDKPIGYLVERRRVAATSGPIMALLTGLIGANARLLIGNASGDVWVDLGTSTPPIVPPGADQSVVTYASPDSGELLLARATLVPETPWHVGVALPRAPVLAPAQRFLMMAITLSCVLVAAGAATGWLMSRRITTPLRLVTEAAEALAVGKLASGIHVRRSDEVGRLATSFNAMAAEVETSRQRLEMLVLELERRVSARTAALEASNRELEAFSYSVSHDLRAPLRAIDGFTRVFIEEYGDHLPPESMHYLQVIIQRTHHMGQLIDGLLAFARLARQPITRTPLDMTVLANAAVRDVRGAEGSHAAEILVAPLPPTQGERVLVQQVLANLLENGLKFSRSRPSPRIEIGHLVKDGENVYYVRDNGVGFDMQYVDKLFGVFQRLHTDEFEGTGVGLALVRRIARRHGGRVWAESVLGEGATFFFTLPPGPPILSLRPQVPPADERKNHTGRLSDRQHESLTTN
jgi:signal transduction histidine kinase